MGYRIGSFHAKQADDWSGYEVYQDGVTEAVSWFESRGAAISECRLRHAEALEKERDALKAENVRLSNQVDDMQHDIGVLSSCGMYLFKDDLESLRTDALADVVVILQNARGEIHELRRDLVEANKMTADAIKLQPPAPIVLDLTPEQITAIKEQLKGERWQKTEIVSVDNRADVFRLRAWLSKIQSYAKTFAPTDAVLQQIAEDATDALEGELYE